MKTITTKQAAKALAVAINPAYVLSSCAMTLAHAIKAAYSSFSAALATAYRIIKSDSAKRQVMRGLQSAYHLCDTLGLVSKSDALFNAFLVLLDLPAMPALKR